MFTCIACSKHLAAGAGSLPDAADAGDTPSTRHAIKAFAAQLKEMATKASGAYRHCRPCSGSAESARRSHHHQRRHSSFADSDSAAMGSDPIQCGYRRAGESFGSASSMSGKTDEEEPAGEEERKEWVAQVEPGVLITFLAVAEDGNDLKRIRFSRDMFNKWQAQRWWAENYDKVMELYNVQIFNRLAGPLPTPPRSEDESSKMESAEESPPTPPLSKEGLSRKFHRSMTGRGTGYSSPDSLDQQPAAHHNIRLNGMDGRHCYDSGAPTSTPKLSSISGMRTETSSVDAASIRTSSEADRSGELSASAVSNTSEKQEKEWVEQDEPGVYITIRAMPGGTRELRRVRFSRERFGEMHARLWWEENRARINEQYL